MEMTEIIAELENKLTNEKTETEKLTNDVERLKAAYMKAEETLKIKKDNIMSLEMMIEAAKEGHFDPSKKEVVKKETVKETVTEEPKDIPTVKKSKQLEWKHKNAFVIKINKFDNVEDRWRTQAAAARSLGWDQSSLSRFMRLDKMTQLAKKGFALVWEY